MFDAARMYSHCETCQHCLGGELHMLSIAWTWYWPGRRFLMLCTQRRCMKTENAQLADGFWKKKQVMHNVLFMINYFFLISRSLKIFQLDIEWYWTWPAQGLKPEFGYSTLKRSWTECCRCDRPSIFLLVCDKPSMWWACSRLAVDRSPGDTCASKFPNIVVDVEVDWAGQKMSWARLCNSAQARPGFSWPSAPGCCPRTDSKAQGLR